MFEFIVSFVYFKFKVIKNSKIINFVLRKVFLIIYKIEYILF